MTLFPALINPGGGCPVFERVCLQDKKAGLVPWREPGDTTLGKDVFWCRNRPDPEEFEIAPKAEIVEILGFVDRVMTVGVLADHDVDSGGFEASKVVELEGPGCSAAF